MLKAGQVFAAGPGITTVVPSFDVETYSEAGYLWDGAAAKWRSLPGLSDQNRGLGAVGVRVYVEHPTFDLLSLKYDLFDGRGMRHFVPRITEFGLADEPHDLIAHVAAGGLLAAWNSGFEWAVWNYHCVPKYGWPVLRPEQMRCDMAKARAHALPGALKNTGKVLQLVNQKDPDGDRLLKKFSMPRNPTKKDQRLRIRPDEDPEDAARLYRYNEIDVLSEVEAGLRIPDLSPMELRFWQVDQAINQRGIQVDDAAVENCIVIVEQAHAKYNAELCALTGGQVEEASEVQRLLGWLKGQGCYMESLAEEFIDARLQPGTSLTTAARRALEIRQMLGSASVKKLFAFRAQSHRGRLYDLYQYFAARTGRWTGNGPQPQNMPKGFFKTVAEVERALTIIAARTLELVEIEYPGRSALEVVSSCLRGLLIAAPGHDLICSDFSAIEGVLTAALAGEEWRLEVFRTHGKIYELSVAKITGRPFAEIMEPAGYTDVSSPGWWLADVKGKHHPLRQTIGKVAELASGFGGWIGAWKRFGADAFMSDDEIKAAILAWRAASPTIPELWGGQSRGRFDTARQELFGLEGAIVAAISYPGQCFAYRQVAYEVRDDVLYCRVPSGGLITYHAPRLAKSTRPYANAWEFEISYEGWNSNPMMGPIGWVRMDLYGGKATENVVQRVARDLHAEGLCALEEAGYRPVLHSHDEPCGEVPKGWGSVEEFERIVCDRIASLPWARTPEGTPWPVNMRGGWRGPRYGKFD
jgi:DNA polymerase bacteriophage-type